MAQQQDVFGTSILAPDRGEAILSVNSLKYYVYISSVKVYMLFSQIPRNFLDGVAAEVKVNFGVVSSALTQKVADETVYS